MTRDLVLVVLFISSVLGKGSVKGENNRTLRSQEDEWVIKEIDDTSNLSKIIYHVISNQEEHAMLDIESQLTNTSDNIAMEIQCQGNSSLFLPVPIVSSKIKELHVTGCRVTGTDRFSNFSGGTENVLRHLVFTDITFELSQYQAYLHLMHWERYKPLFPYGMSIIPTSLNTFKETNVSYVYLEADFQQEHVYLDKVVEYREHLRAYQLDYQLIYVEMSNSQGKDTDNVIDVHYDNINDFLRIGRFPLLQVMNFSGMGLKHLPDAIRRSNWWWTKFPSLIHVDLSYNHFERIPFITYTTSLMTISLNLRDNDIAIFSDRDFLRSYPLEIDLFNNKFDCYCSRYLKEMITSTKTFHLKFKKRYRYLENITCYHPEKFRGLKITDFDVSNLCGIAETSISCDNIYLQIIILMSVVIFILLIMFVIFKYRKELEILSYTRLRIKFRKPIPPESYLVKEYDAFLSYSHHDEWWVKRRLIPRLTGAPPNLRLCLHERDFKLGAFISDNIIESIDNSRHTIMIISEGFLASKWCALEFKTAFHQNLQEKNGHLIAVLMNNIDYSLLDNDMKHYLETHTFLKQNELLFWDKLIYALNIRKDNV